MSPAPDLTAETIILHPPSSSAALNAVSSSDELDQHPFNEQHIDLGSLTIESMDSVDLTDDEDYVLRAPTKEAEPKFTTCSAPSTPTGERDPPVAFRRPSVSATTAAANTELSQIEVKYQGVVDAASTNSDDGSGLIDTFLGCFKPIFSAVNKIGENIKYHKDNALTTSTLSKPVDDWEIPIDSIMNNLILIGTGIEGTVYLGKLGGQNVACKRVKTEEETNVKHLRKLNHVNVIKFRGVSVAAPLFYIVMEYCTYGSLYEVLKRRREKNSCTKPTQVLDWARQISNGVNYLHVNKIVHRDLKSPNILIADKFILKISDFGTCKHLVNGRSQVLSFNGTSAWMAPEVIRQEPCSLKIDVWSFGIVLWEILTCAVPYHNIDPNAVMWGVGKGSLTLPIPSSVPEGLKLLMNMCWNQRPTNRPSFQQIIKHLDISEPEITLFEQEQEYAELTRAWSIEINEQLARLPSIDFASTLEMSNDDLIKKRKEELQHIADIRAHYQAKLQQVNTIYIELSSMMMQLQKREQEIKKKERSLDIQQQQSSSSNKTSGKKRTMQAISDARRKSLQLIKAASLHINDPMMISSQLSAKRGVAMQSNSGLPYTQPSVGVHGSPNQSNPIKTSSSTAISNQDSSSVKTIGRRKKSVGHRRTNSKGSTASWTPPSMSTIAAQETKRASINITSNVIEEAGQANPTSDSSGDMTPLPSISADIDSKSKATSRQLNPKTLKLDLHNAISSPTTDRQIPTLFTYDTRKSSTSGAEDVDNDQYYNLARQRRRRPMNASGINKIASPSSATSRSIKSIIHEPQTSAIDEVDPTNRAAEAQNDDDEKQVDPRKYLKNVTFHFSPSSNNDRSPSYPHRKTFNRPTRYSSSEEGEVEEVPSDHYVFDDERHRAMHEDLNRQSGGLFSSESEIYKQSNNHSSSSTSSKNGGMISDEGGHVSDDRPESRGSLVNSEPEHE